MFDMQSAILKARRSIESGHDDTIADEDEEKEEMQLLDDSHIFLRILTSMSEHKKPFLKAFSELPFHDKVCLVEFLVDSVVLSKAFASILTVFSDKVESLRAEFDRTRPLDELVRFLLFLFSQSQAFSLQNEVLEYPLRALCIGRDRFFRSYYIMSDDMTKIFVQDTESNWGKFMHNVILNSARVL
jgi:hypothetical protein